ncbi:MAG TPA: hypothetical protein VGE63_01825 [Candidatus Paceibacterota bacterium]
MKTIQTHFHHHKKIYLNIFLIAYGIASILHIITTLTNDATFWALGAFIAGLIVAIYSHNRHGYETIALLLIHMGIEWWQHAQHINIYTLKEYIFHSIHAILDTILLVEESHHFKNRNAFLMIVALGLLGLVIWSFFKTEHHFGIHMLAHTHSHTHSAWYTAIEAAVSGGIIGCIISHLYRLNIKKAGR